MRLRSAAVLALTLAATFFAVPLQATEAPADPVTEPRLAAAESPSCEAGDLDLDLFTARGQAGERSACTATAQCGANGTVSCNGNSTCTAVDRNCSVLQGGYVTCDGVRTDCPSSSACTSQCFSEYLACRDACPDRPCLSDCQDQLNVCRCYC